MYKLIGSFGIVVLRAEKYLISAAQRTIALSENIGVPSNLITQETWMLFNLVHWDDKSRDKKEEKLLQDLCRKHLENLKSYPPDHNMSLSEFQELAQIFSYNTTRVGFILIKESETDIDLQDQFSRCANQILAQAGDQSGIRIYPLRVFCDWVVKVSDDFLKMM